MESRLGGLMVGMGTLDFDHRASMRWCKFVVLRNMRTAEVGRCDAVGIVEAVELRVSERSEEMEEVVCRDTAALPYQQAFPEPPVVIQGDACLSVVEG